MQNAFFLVDHDMVKNILAIFRALNIPLQVGEEKRHIVIKDLWVPFFFLFLVTLYYYRSNATMPINFNPVVEHKSILELHFSTYAFDLFYVG